MTVPRLVLGGGCSWGIEELFRDQLGVIDTEVGYAGGDSLDPTYYSHEGHAEVVEITYDETKTSLKTLLKYFFTIHDPTTYHQQGNDIGSSYRSIIFYESSSMKQEIEAVIETVNCSGAWNNPVVTEVAPLAEFYPAEPEHQDYLQKHPGGYTCHYERDISYT